jgi:hypothetical protein
MNNKLENWFLPQTTVSSIHYDRLELKLYDGTVIKGNEAANMKLHKSFIPVKKVIQNIILSANDRYGVPDNLYFQVTESLFKNEEITRFMTVLRLDHGYKIPSNKTYSCIEWVQIPISLKFNFNEIET